LRVGKKAGLALLGGGSTNPRGQPTPGWDPPMEANPAGAAGAAVWPIRHSTWGDVLTTIMRLENHQVSQVGVRSWDSYDESL
jgi:hypothetical protein